MGDDADRKDLEKLRGLIFNVEDEIATLVGHGSITAPDRCQACVLPVMHHPGERRIDENCTNTPLTYAESLVSFNQDLDNFLDLLDMIKKSQEESGFELRFNGMVIERDEAIRINHDQSLDFKVREDGYYAEISDLRNKVTAAHKIKREACEFGSSIVKSRDKDAYFAIKFLEADIKFENDEIGETAYIYARRLHEDRVQATERGTDADNLRFSELRERQSMDLAADSVCYGTDEIPSVGVPSGRRWRHFRRLCRKFRS